MSQTGNPVKISARISEKGILMNQCSGCGKYFRSVGAFDFHRTGKFEPKTADERRRCLTTGEMIEAGMHADDKGTWRGPASEELTFKEKPAHVQIIQ